MAISSRQRRPAVFEKDGTNLLASVAGSFKESSMPRGSASIPTSGHAHLS